VYSGDGVTAPGVRARYSVTPSYASYTGQFCIDVPLQRSCNDLVAGWPATTAWSTISSQRKVRSA
jgi:hypothetical protein